MTEHEDLIAEVREEIETWDMDNGALIPRLVGALEKVAAERDALAAVVDYMRRLTESSDWNGGQVDDILSAAPSVALDRVKAEALREAADYLDSFEGPGGRQSAHDRAGRDIIRLIRDRADRI